ncbi:iron chelate uptake ABC transporter family permease subunit [Rhodocytophaga rosea]|uniref:Iron chelate uptake ABC transporter family permease subunit n=1 Tax=Rhodocytophaga rosea TaxID=2704465 RepID=A0A6C0GSQ7_9BACT|nr:iron chelate uptake ABC transporter family permease subunit [Rhodocytophaga rosea]QHT71191.1 iron chelate uptake ABC transporter family permease subunit [Rhodocytophaga rosea]
MNNFIEFFSFSDPNIRFVTFGSMLLSASAAIVGCFALLRKRALIGDAIAHSVLPGVCLAFIISEQKNPLLLLIGAFATGWLSLICIDLITSRTKIKEDTAIGLVLSVFFGIGILLLTAIQQQGNASQSGLDKFLFGKAASMVQEDVIVFSSVSLLLLLVVWLFYKEFKLLCFDENFARSIGLPVRRLEWLLTSLTVLSVVTGIQAVGVVLMAAILITPAAAARFWTDKLLVMLLLSAAFGAFSALTGAYISYLSPAMPTGPWMVMVISVIAVGSFILAPGKGIFARWQRQQKNRRQIVDENILKTFFHLNEKDKQFYIPHTIAQLLEKRRIEKPILLSGLKRLASEGYLEKSGHTWKLTKEGKERGKRITRLHRLWELYLTKYLHLAPDHVHEDAENIEHVITPELEEKIMEQLQYPDLDPHNSQIPK